MSNLPFGIDISRYQYSSDGSQKPNFDLMNATCDFVAVRAGISWGYTDPWFAYSWAHITKPRLAYHVIYLGECWAASNHFLNIVQPSVRPSCTRHGIGSRLLKRGSLIPADLHGTSA